MKRVRPLPLHRIRRAHFVGIGGAGMSSLARLLMAAGLAVSGSNHEPSAAADALAAAGARIVYGQDESTVPVDAELIIYSAAIPELDPTFFDFLRSRGIPLMEYHEAVGAYAVGRRVVAIAGTHGKTTTTAMLTTILAETDFPANALVGGVVKATGSGVYLGGGDTFVVEADEYRRGFLNLSPNVLVITNVDHDHVDCFPTIGEVIEVFGELARRVGDDGVIIADPSLPHVSDALAGVSALVIDYRSVPIEPSEVPLPGEHNRRNAQAALAAAAVLGVPDADARRALASFSGTGRRFEEKGHMECGATVVDDYAHNPQKVRAVLAAVRERFPGRRVIALFQPHLYSRTKALLSEFAESFGDADSVVVLPIYAAREPFDASIASADLVAVLTARGVQAETVASKDAALARVRSLASANAVVLTIGAGDVTELSDMLVSSSGAVC